jgi:hypothetical protein
MSNEIMQELWSDVITEQDFIHLGWKKIVPSEHGWYPADFKDGEYFYDYTDVNELGVDSYSSSNFEAEENGWSFGRGDKTKFYSRTLLYNMMGLIAQFEEHAAKNME